MAEDGAQSQWHITDAGQRRLQLSLRVSTPRPLGAIEQDASPREMHVYSLLTHMKVHGWSGCVWQSGMMHDASGKRLRQPAAFDPSDGESKQHWWVKLNAQHGSVMFEYLLALATASDHGQR
eukprot:9481710-Alexandrium_andersonii.AAC.1